MEDNQEQQNKEVGRPTVITNQVLLKLETAFALGCTDLEACVYADISKTALYEYQKDHPEFTERKELLKETPILKARTAVVNALEGDYEHALKFLERKNKLEFSLRQEVTGKDGNAIQVEPITGMKIINDGDRIQNKES